MPIKKLCPRCNRAIDVGLKTCIFCGWNRHKGYDRLARNRQASDFYHSKEWIVTRELVLSRYNYLDVYQLMVNGVVVPADTVHHIEELNDRWDLRVSLDNLVPLAHGTHNEVHGEYKKDRESVQRVLRECMKKYEECYRG